MLSTRVLESLSLASLKRRNPEYSKRWERSSISVQHFELIKALKVDHLPFWQPNIFHGEGAITSEVIASTWKEGVEFQSIDLLAILLEILKLLYQRWSISLYQRLDPTKIMNLENREDAENETFAYLKGWYFLLEQETKSTGLTAVSCKEQIHLAASSELVAPSYRIRICISVISFLV